MTQVSIVGNTTSELEIRYTQGGKAAGSVTVAVNRQRGDVEETDFHRVTLWESLAENAAQLPKGTRVIVVGRLTSREYEDRQQQKRTGWEITADAFGPDLRFASADVTRSERARAPRTRDNGPSGYTAQGADAWDAETPF